MKKGWVTPAFFMPGGFASSAIGEAKDINTDYQGAISVHTHIDLIRF